MRREERLEDKGDGRGRQGGEGRGGEGRGGERRGEEDAIGM
jgi:hypothetical protein